MKHMRKYWAVAWIAAKTNLAYASEVVSRLAFLGVVLFVFMRLWQATYLHAAAQKLGGLTLTQMLWYLAITEAIVLSAPKVAPAVDQDVRTGAICTQLVRPLSYPLYRLFSYLGERVVRFAVTLGASATIAWLLVGVPPFSLEQLLSFALTVSLAFVLDFGGNFLVGLGAFWMEDTTGLNLIYSRFTMILGGMLVPLQLFPQTWRLVLDNLPFASLINGPARLFVSFNLSAFGDVVLHQLAWAAVFALLVRLVYGQALGRIAANGG